MRAPHLLSVSFRPCSSEDLPAVKHLLSRCGLPSSDLTRETLDHFICATADGSMIGIVGIEPQDATGLIRSLAVAPSHRNGGVASALVERAEQAAVDLGIVSAYALTETAEGFLIRRGYRRVERDAAPESIRETTEFRTLCPESAVLMEKAFTAR